MHQPLRKRTVPKTECDYATVHLSVEGVVLRTDRQYFSETGGRSCERSDINHDCGDTCGCVLLVLMVE